MMKNRLLVFETEDFVYGYQYQPTLTPLKDIGNHTIYISNISYSDIEMRLDDLVVDIYVKNILIYTDRVSSSESKLDYSFSNNALKIWIVNKR